MPKKEKPKRSGLEGILQNTPAEGRTAQADTADFLDESVSLPWEAPAAFQIAGGEAAPEAPLPPPSPRNILIRERGDMPGGERQRKPRRDGPDSPPTSAPQTALDQIRTAPLKAPRPDRRKREPVVSYRGIPETLQRNLDRLADERDLPVGVLARFFLEHGLQETAGGGMSLSPQLVRVGLTLYPEAEGSAPRRRRRGSSARGATPKKSARPVAFRGIPQETAHAVAELANRLGVPIGEIARFFLEAGIQQVRSGELQLQTYPLPSALRTLYPEE